MAYECGGGAIFPDDVVETVDLRDDSSGAPVFGPFGNDTFACEGRFGVIYEDFIPRGKGSDACLLVGTFHGCSRVFDVAVDGVIRLF